MSNHEKLRTVALTIRRQALTMIYHAGSGHPGGSLSCADLLAYLWTEELNKAPGSSECLDGNRFVLSKGHACPALYAVAAERGVIEQRELLKFRKLNSPLQGHPHVGCLPCVDTSTGSLGQGFSVAIGMALGFKYKRSSARVYVMLGDGEMQEGQVWEGAMAAAHFKLDNLCAIIDYNKIQSDDYNEKVMALEPLRAKWEAFNWHVREIDGHDFVQIQEALQEAKKVEKKPVMIIAHTKKGKGVSFMEGSTNWHGSVKLEEKELVQALTDLAVPRAEIGGYLDAAIWK